MIPAEYLIHLFKWSITVKEKVSRSLEHSKVLMICWLLLKAVTMLQVKLTKLKVLMTSFKEHKQGFPQGQI